MGLESLGLGGRVQAGDAMLTATEAAQARALRAMGVPFRTRPDGTLLVGRIAAERALAGPVPVEPQRQAAANGLRWSRTA